MSDLQTRFETASKEVQDLTKRPDNTTLLKLYAFYKQGSQGDVAGKRPGITNFKGRAKHDAWAELKAMDKADAMQSYIDLVELLKGKE